MLVQARVADSFNPTMVRLLPSNPFCLISRLMFQSHNGAIAAPAHLHELAEILAVSIPQWCDCCNANNGLHWKNISFQSHNGAIAANDGMKGVRR